MTLDYQNIWNNCLDNIKSKIGEQGYSTWFKPIKPLRIDGNIFTIQVPSQFFYEYIEEHYVHLLRAVLNEVLGPEYKLEYSVVIDRGSDHSKPYMVNLPNSGKVNNKYNNLICNI